MVKMTSTSSWINKNCLFATDKKTFRCEIKWLGKTYHQGYTDAVSPEKAIQNFWWRSINGDRVKIDKLKNKGYKCECQEPIAPVEQTQPIIPKSPKLQQGVLF